MPSGDSRTLVRRKLKSVASVKTGVNMGSLRTSSSQSLLFQGFIQTRSHHRNRSVHRSQSLFFQGFIQTTNGHATGIPPESLNPFSFRASYKRKNGLNCRTRPKVSIPFLSGLHTNSFSILIGESSWVSIPFLSGLHTNRRHKWRRLHKSESQSLFFQGFIQTLRWPRRSVRLERLNPFSFRASYKRNCADGFSGAWVSQSLFFQGFIQTTPEVHIRVKSDCLNPFSFRASYKRIDL